MRTQRVYRLVDPLALDTEDLRWERHQSSKSMLAGLNSNMQSEGEVQLDDDNERENVGRFHSSFSQLLVPSFYDNIETLE